MEDLAQAALETKYRQLSTVIGLDKTEYLLVSNIHFSITEINNIEFAISKDKDGYNYIYTVRDIKDFYDDYKQQLTGNYLKSDVTFIGFVQSYKKRMVGYQSYLYVYKYKKIICDRDLLYYQNN